MPNWERISKDFPDFYQKLTNKKYNNQNSNINPYHEIVVALDEEKIAVREELNKYPISILSFNRAHELEEPGDIIYYEIGTHPILSKI